MTGMGRLLPAAFEAASVRYPRSAVDEAVILGGRQCAENGRCQTLHPEAYHLVPNMIPCLRKLVSNHGAASLGKNSGLVFHQC